MTDKELIRAMRCCTCRPDRDKCAEECVFYKGNDVDGCVPEMGVTVSNRMEALLNELAEMNQQVQKEICKRVEVEAENERLKAGKDMNVPAKWVSVSERLPEENSGARMDLGGADNG